MALSLELTNFNLTADSIKTEAEITLDAALES